MKIFILDDLRSIDEAIANTKYPGAFAPEYEYHIARTIEEAESLLALHSPFDVWVLDNDLGIVNGVAEEGSRFLRNMIVNHPEYVPSTVVSCSSNPARRLDIEALAHNWEMAGRPRVDYI